MKPGRLSRFWRAVSPWWQAATFFVFFVICGGIVRSEHLHDECLPARCFVDRATAHRSGTLYTPMVAFHATKQDGEFLGRAVFFLRDEKPSREEAKAVAEADARRLGQTFACYYHPRYREYLTTEPHGRYGQPVAMTAFALLMFALALRAGTREWRERRRQEELDAVDSLPRFRGRERLERLYYARDFLPKTPPPGWSVPYVIKDGEEGWMLDAGQEGVLASLERSGPFWGLRVYITTRGGAKTGAIPSDARCAEILGHLRGVGEFVECKGVDAPCTRAWLGLPRALRPRWRPPVDVPAPSEAPLNPLLADARKHLPEKLPPDWSVPVAMTDDHGTEWTDGSWMFSVDDLMVLVALCTSRGRIKLCVTIFHPPGEPLGEGAALDVLKHFRGVVEFTQGDRHSEGFVTYLGEIGDRRRDLATLN